MGLPFSSLSCKQIRQQRSPSVSKVKELLDLRICVLWILDSVANSSWVAVELVIVSALVCLISEEVDSRENSTSGKLSFVFEMVKAVSLVPAFGEDVE